ncbi:hypothetical protein ES319_A01G073200v1 [Gossypium barbadense]|uniref:Uncharacterized protein n=2 Tax=Gossypium TaxID=3633 RepID=A0A5J5WT29_GOSBA|nr:hypothetical protein ES319_A01G073200v1 [Gossypium barbadense]TYH30260.1 hypothetical protein ES288_A01G080400v1 [Gossypium darwinii]
MASAAKLEQMLHRNLFCKNPLSEATISQIQGSRQAVHIAHKAQMKVLLASVVLFSRVQSRKTCSRVSSPCLYL